MKIATICENRTFSNAYKKGRKCAGKYSVVYALKKRCGKVRIGLTVTKARGGAVTRNRIKRVLRHAYYEVFGKCGIPEGYDLIIVARDAAAYVKSDKAAADLYKSLLFLGVVSEPEKDKDEICCDGENNCNLLKTVIPE